MKKRDQRFGEILISKGLMSEADLDNALREQRLTREFLGRILVRNHYVSEKDIMETVSEQSGMPIMSLKDLYIDWDVVKRFSSSVILQDRCFPVRKDGKLLTIAILNPLDAWALKRAEDASGGIRANFVLVTYEDMETILTRYKQFIRKTVNGMLE